MTEGFVINVYMPIYVNYYDKRIFNCEHVYAYFTERYYIEMLLDTYIYIYKRVCLCKSFMSNDFR